MEPHRYDEDEDSACCDLPKDHPIHTAFTPTASEAPPDPTNNQLP